MIDSQQFYSLLSEIYLLLDDGDRRLLNRFQLTPARYYALLHLGDRPGISLSELSDMMLCDKSNATRIIKAMEADKLVYRLPHETDGRAVRLYLSQDGEQLRREVMVTHQDLNESRFKSIRDEKGMALIQHLRHLKDNLQEQLDTTGAV